MEVDHVKLALPTSQFKYMPMYKMMVDSTVHTTALIGHNRHATKGASDNSAYAHPFQHGHINLMHNGSLTTHHHLTTETFVVDSEAICKALVDTPIEELVPKLRGAFALVWVDSKEQTLNFVRNNERPLALAVNTKKNTLYWASEKDMLKWLLNREGLTTSKVDYDELFELPVGQVWSFPITKNSVNVADVKVTDVELTAAYTYPQYSRGGNTTAGKPQTKTSTTSSGSTATTVTETSAISASEVKKGLDENTAKYRHNHKAEKELTDLAKKSIEKQGRGSTGFRTYVNRVDEMSLTELESRIGIFCQSFKAYEGSSKNILGEVKGRMLEFPYSDVVLHAIPKKQYEEIVGENEGLATGYFAAATVPNDLKYRHSITALEELQRFEINIKYGSVCLLRNITDWDCKLHPILSVREMLEKEEQALPFPAATVTK